MMKTAAAQNPSGLTFSILLCQNPNIGENITCARGLTATIVLYFHRISSSELLGSSYKWPIDIFCMLDDIENLDIK